MMKKPSLLLLLLLSSSLLLLVMAVRGHDYGGALSKSILFFEGQRSGRLPPDQRVTWRRDSAAADGSEVGADLEGGYYDAGDNVKFGFPMAFTTTMLAWSVVEFGEFMPPDELGHATAAVRWGADYLLKTMAHPDRIYVQVGDPMRDHNCWERPEDMDTARTVYSVGPERPGSEVAGETAAALAASSMVFSSVEPEYSERLLRGAMGAFEFADRYKGAYSDDPYLKSGVCPFYCDFDGYQVHMCNKLASRHVRVGLAEPSEVPRCDICENAPAFFYCEIDGSSLCLQCDMIVHVGGKRTHRRYLLLRQRVQFPGDIPGQSEVLTMQSRDQVEKRKLMVRENLQNHIDSTAPASVANHGDHGMFDSKLIDLNAKPHRTHGQASHNNGTGPLSDNNHDSAGVVPSRTVKGDREK